MVRRILIGASALVIAAIVAVVVWGGDGEKAKADSTITSVVASTTTTTTTTKPTTTTTRASSTTSSTTSTTAAPECVGTWKVVQADNGQHRWFSEGIESIRLAADEEQARLAIGEWLGRVRQDPQLLAGAAGYILDKEVDPASLLEGNCASASAGALVAEMELTLASSSMKPQVAAPANGVNSGVASDGSVVVAQTAGIKGDRTSVEVTLPDGSKIWVMARCGNPVVKSPPPHIPSGPTDNPPPGEKPTCPDGQPVPETGLCPKGPTKDHQLNPGFPPTERQPGEPSEGNGPDAPRTPGTEPERPTITTSPSSSSSPPVTSATTAPPATTSPVVPTTAADSGDGRTPSVTVPPAPDPTAPSECDPTVCS